MDGKLKTHQFVHVPPVQEADDNKCLNESSENDGEESTVPLGLTGKAVCMQVCAMFSSIYFIHEKFRCAIET